VVNRYAPKAYLDKQRESFNVAAQKLATAEPAKSGIDSTSTGSIEISQYSVNKIREGLVEKEIFNQEISNKNSDLPNSEN
jgi:hypothetical protein